MCHVSRVVPRRVASHGCAADAESCGACVSGALASGAGHTQTSPPEKLPKDRGWFVASVNVQSGANIVADTD